jgi:hypothetical protein
MVTSTCPSVQLAEVSIRRIIFCYSFKFDFLYRIFLSCLPVRHWHALVFDGEDEISSVEKARKT